MDNTKEILTLAVEIGDAMLRCGAEIYRVEDSVIRILEAFGLDDFDAFFHQKQKNWRKFCNR